MYLLMKESNAANFEQFDYQYRKISERKTKIQLEDVLERFWERILSIALFITVNEAGDLLVWVFLIVWKRLLHRFWILVMPYRRNVLIFECCHFRIWERITWCWYAKDFVWITQLCLFHKLTNFSKFQYFACYDDFLQYNRFLY